MRSWEVEHGDLGYLVFFRDLVHVRVYSSYGTCTIDTLVVAGLAGLHAQ